LGHALKMVIVAAEPTRGESAGVGLACLCTPVARVVDLLRTGDFKWIRLVIAVLALCQL